MPFSGAMALDASELLPVIDDLRGRRDADEAELGEQGGAGDAAQWMVAAAASPPRAGWTRRLVITKQPSPEFYKDEGDVAAVVGLLVSM